MSNAAINKSENQLILSILDGEGRREEDEDELVDVVAEDADLGEAKQEVEAAHHGAVPAEGASRVRMRTNLVWNKVQLRIEKNLCRIPEHDTKVARIAISARLNRDEAIQFVCHVMLVSRGQDSRLQQKCHMNFPDFY